MRMTGRCSLAVLALVLVGCSTSAEGATVPSASPPQAAAPPSATPTPVTVESAGVSDQAAEGAAQPAEENATTDNPAPAEGTPRPVRQIIEYEVPQLGRVHDVAPAPDGTVWYTEQGGGALGRLDPATGEVRIIPLPTPSGPHGVIVGPDGAAWVTDGGANAIVRVDGTTEAVTTFPLPPDRANTNLNTAAFDRNGVLWFTGQTGIYGRLDPATGEMEVYSAPRGRGPYGIAATPDGDIYFASLAGSYVGRIDIDTGDVTVLEPPTPNQGARRVWSDSQGRIWVAEWNAGQLALYDPASGEWREWPLPGSAPKAYAVYVDEQDIVWVTDFGGNALVRFDPAIETFDVFPHQTGDAAVRQLLGRPGEVWGAESGLNRLFVLYSAP